MRQAILSRDENTANAIMDSPKIQNAIDIPDRKGETALMLAVDRKMLKTTESLCSKGAKVNAVNHEGNSALHCLATGSMTQVTSEKIMDILLKYGIGPNIKNNVGKTARDIATPEMCRTLDRYTNSINEAALNVVDFYQKSKVLSRNELENYEKVKVNYSGSLKNTTILQHYEGVSEEDKNALKAFKKLQEADFQRAIAIATPNSYNHILEDLSKEVNVAKDTLENLSALENDTAVRQTELRKSQEQVARKAQILENFKIVTEAVEKSEVVKDREKFKNVAVHINVENVLKKLDNEIEGSYFRITGVAKKIESGPLSHLPPEIKNKIFGHLKLKDIKKPNAENDKISPPPATPATPVKKVATKELG